ncbi:MAG: hypothetical protein AAFW83_08720 [Pseudomonadota bacterium]
MRFFKLPLMGIQIALIVAFFMHTISCCIDLSVTINGWAQVDYDRGSQLYLYAKYLENFAFGIFYLGEAAIIQCLLVVANRLPDIRNSTQKS